MKKDITCLLALHAEGLIAHKTIRAINRAIVFAEENDLTTELVIVLDQPTAETKAYTESSSIINPASRLITTDLGDLGLVRNVGVDASNGEHIAILDGDDLISQNWLLRAHQVSQMDARHVVHPEVSVYFDHGAVVFYHLDQTLDDFHEANIAIENCWTSLCFSRRQTFVEIPYLASPKSSGFGYEDWHWNCEVMSKGLVHVVAAGTAHFIRVKAGGGLNVESGMRNALMRHSALFDKWAIEKSEDDFQRLQND